MTLRRARAADADLLASLAQWVWLDSYAPEGVDRRALPYLAASFTPAVFEQRVADPACALWVLENGAGLSRGERISAIALARLRGVYSDNLIEVVEWCMALDPLSRPQSVFALQKELSREGERRYTKLTVAEKVRMQFDNIVADNRKSSAPTIPGGKRR